MSLGTSDLSRPPGSTWSVVTTMLVNERLTLGTKHEAASSPAATLWWMLTSGLKMP